MAVSTQPHASARGTSRPARRRATSPRASAAVATTIATTATIRVNQPASPGRSVSPSTTTPSTDPTTGSLTVIVGSDAVSEPARNDDCCHAVPAMATSAHAYSSGVSHQRPQPVVEPVDDTLGQHREQRPTARRTPGRAAPRRRGALDHVALPVTHSTSAGPENGHHRGPRLEAGARVAFGRVADGDDHRHGGGQQRRPHPLPAGDPAAGVSRALIGSANSSEVTSSACTSSTEPKPSAAACSAKPARGDQAAQPPLPVREQPDEQLDVADRFVGDVVGRALLDDVADRDEERSAEGEQGGDVRLAPSPAPPVVACARSSLRQMSLRSGSVRAQDDLFE